MSNVTLNKNALTVPSIVFNDGILSSNTAGNLTWNGEEYHPSGNTGNVFTEYVTFNGGMISNGDIILNGSKLLLANGAAVEIYDGTDIPLPENNGNSSNGNASTECEYLKVKEDVDYHLENNWKHLSFTEHKAINKLYYSDDDNHVSYYDTNAVDNVDSANTISTNKIIINAPYFAEGTLGAIQMLRGETAAIQCQLLLSFYDKNDNLLIKKVSTNTWDYSLEVSVANFFFQPFDIPHKASKMVLEFTTDGTTPIADYIPAAYLVGASSEGGIISTPDGDLNYIAYIVQFTPDPILRGLIPDTKNIFCECADGNVATGGYANVTFGDLSLGGTSTIVDGIIVTPTVNNCWLQCIAKFEDGTTDSYIKVNDKILYHGATLLGTTPFAVNLLLAPGDVFEASATTKIENMRLIGCK